MGWGCGKDTVLNSGAVGGGRAQVRGGLCLEEGGQEALARASAGGSLHAYHLGPVVWLGSVEPCLLGLWLKLVWCGVVVARLHNWRKLPSGPVGSVGLGLGGSLLEAQDHVCAWAASFFGELLRYSSGLLTTTGCCTCLRTAGGPARGGTGRGLNQMLRAARALEDEKYSDVPASLPSLLALLKRPGFVAQGHLVGVGPEVRGGWQWGLKSRLLPRLLRSGGPPPGTALSSATVRRARLGLRGTRDSSCGLSPHWVSDFAFFPNLRAVPGTLSPLPSSQVMC